MQRIELGGEKLVAIVTPEGNIDGNKEGRRT